MPPATDKVIPMSGTPSLKSLGIKPNDAEILEAAYTLTHDSTKTDEVIEQGRAAESMYPDYVETGDAYSLIADACVKKSDRKCAVDELGRYSKEGGRDAATVKKYAKLLEEDGRLKEAEAALERLNFIYPLDPELHDRLGNL